MSGPIGTLTGDIVGGNKITYGLSAEELIAVLEKKGILATATNARLDRQTIVALAQRLNPDEALEFDQAIAELEHAVTVALDVIATGEPRRKRDEFVNIVLARVAQNTRLGDFDGGASAIDYGLAELDSAYPTQPVAKPA